MIVDASHQRWVLGCGAAAVAGTVLYVVLAPAEPRFRSGGWLGLTFGIIAFALMLFAGLLGARRKVPGWRIGRMQTWMRAHLWLGLLSLPFVWLHAAGAWADGPLTKALMLLFYITVASGVIGAVAQAVLPTMMTAQVPMETIYQQIPAIRQQLLEEAKQLYTEVTQETQAAAAAANDSGSFRSILSAAEPLREFWEDEVFPFLVDPRGRHELATQRGLQQRFNAIYMLLPRGHRQPLAGLEQICVEENQLSRQETLHRWMHGWLLIHVPVSYAVLLLTVVHAIAALRY
jgi:hypothetical protein